MTETTAKLERRARAAEIIRTLPEAMPPAARQVGGRTQQITGAKD